MLTKEEIQDYQRIHKSLFQQEISFENAREQGIMLINFLEATLK